MLGELGTAEAPSLSQRNPRSKPELPWKPTDPLIGFTVQSTLIGMIVV